MLDDALLSRLRTELSQNLSSVLNAPDSALTDDSDPALEALLKQGEKAGEEEEEEQESLSNVLHRFYAPARNAFRLFYLHDSTANGDNSNSNNKNNDREDDEIPAEFCVPLYRPMFTDEALSPLFLQKLSHLLDAVELGLVRETARRASAFFAALTQLRQLHQGVAKAVATIQAARKSVHAVESAVALPGIALAALQRRRCNIEQATACLQRLQEQICHEARVDALIEEGKLLEALELDESSGEQKVFFFFFFFFFFKLRPTLLSSILKIFFKGVFVLAGSWIRSS